MESGRLLGTGRLFRFEHVHLNVEQYMSEKHNKYLTSRTVTAGAVIVIMSILRSDEKAAGFIIHSSNHSILRQCLECYIRYGGAYWSRSAY